MGRPEDISMFLGKNPSLGSFFSRATAVPMYKGADIVRMKWKMEGEDDGATMLVIVMLTRGKTISRSSPVPGARTGMYVERWISRAEDGLYALPFGLDDVFGPVEELEEDIWMSAAMNCESWIYEKHCCKKCLRD